MTVLFSESYGRVRKLAIPGAMALKSGIGISPKIDFEDRKSIITSITVNEQPNVQFRNSLGNQVFIYVFGDLPGQATISGISFAETCQGLSQHGLNKMREYYHDNKVSSRKDPIRLLIGGGGFEIQGYLVGWTGNVVNPESRVFEWGMRLRTIPQETLGGDN